MTCDKNSNCIKCEADKILFENRCLYSCPQGFRKSRNGEGKLICVNCNANCKNCDEGGKCFDCLEGYFLNKDNNKCESFCSRGMYLKNNKCETCGYNCDKCIDKENCLQCKDSSSLDKNKCLDKCPNNSVLINNKCVQCKTLDENCSKCTENALDKCTACVEGFYLLNNSCVKTCPKGYFLNERNRCQSK